MTLKSYSRRFFASPALLALAMFSFGAAPTDKSELPVKRLVGQRFANFSAKDVVSGRKVTRDDFRGKNAVVLAFLGTDCPIANLYVPRLIELNKVYKSRGVVMIGVNSNAHETFEQVAAYVKEYKIDFPVRGSPETPNLSQF